MPFSLQLAGSRPGGPLRLWGLTSWRSGTSSARPLWNGSCAFFSALCSAARKPVSAACRAALCRAVSCRVSYSREWGEKVGRACELKTRRCDLHCSTFSTKLHTHTHIDRTETTWRQTRTGPTGARTIRVSHPRCGRRAGGEGGEAARRRGICRERRGGAFPPSLPRYVRGLAHSASPLSLARSRPRARSLTLARRQLHHDAVL